MAPSSGNPMSCRFVSFKSHKVKPLKSTNSNDNRLILNSAYTKNEPARHWSGTAATRRDALAGFCLANLILWHRDREHANPSDNGAREQISYVTEDMTALNNHRTNGYEICDIMGRFNCLCISCYTAR